jgi:hypothetical protein
MPVSSCCRSCGGRRRCRARRRCSALLGGGSGRQLETQLVQGFPFLPPACRLVLDPVSQDAVLHGLRACLSSRRPALLPGLRSLAAKGLLWLESGLADWLRQLGIDPADCYAIAGAGFTALRRQLGGLPGGVTAEPHPVAEGFCAAVEDRLTRANGVSGGCFAPSSTASLRDDCVDAEAWRLRLCPALAAPARGPRRALAGGVLAAGGVPPVHVRWMLMIRASRMWRSSRSGARPPRQGLAARSKALRGWPTSLREQLPWSQGLCWAAVEESERTLPSL